MSDPINIDGLPNPPNIGYYDNSKSKKSINYDLDKPNPTFNSYELLQENLNKSCKIDKNNGLYYKNSSNEYDDSIKIHLPNGSSTPVLDIPYYLAKDGVLDLESDDNSLTNIVNTACLNANRKKGIVNQIKYLTCQLIKERNRQYSASSFNINGSTSVKSIFEQFKNIKVILVFLFFLSFYLFMSGFFGSFDVGLNIFSIIHGSNDGSITYWIGLLFGLMVPLVILCVVYSLLVCKNLKDLEKFDITDNSYGKKQNIPNDLKSFDIITLILFLFLLYALVAVLFTIKKESFNPIFYAFFVGSILLIICIVMYILYAYIPFFNTTNETEMANNIKRPLKLFVDNQQKISDISSNQYHDEKIRKTFLYTFLFLLVLSFGFFIFNRNGKTNPFFNGIFGSFAILIIPALWIFNFVIAINYFFFYPIILIIFRYIRYAIMTVLYVMSEKNSSLKDGFSDELVDQLNDFKNYTPSWGLIGVDEYKIFMNYLGFENTFSKLILKDYSENSNISSNKFVSSLFLVPLVIQKLAGESSNNIIIYGIIIFVLTIIIASIILFGILKI